MITVTPKELLFLGLEHNCGLIPMGGVGHLLPPGVKNPFKWASMMNIKGSIKKFSKQKKAYSEEFFIHNSLPLSSFYALSLHTKNQYIYTLFFSPDGIASLKYPTDGKDRYKIDVINEGEDLEKLFFSEMLKFLIESSKEISSPIQLTCFSHRSPPYYDVNSRWELYVNDAQTFPMHIDYIDIVSPELKKIFDDVKDCLKREDKS